MPDLRSLGLNEESAPQVDWDAPQGGQTPPPITPGVWYLKVVMPESHDDWFDGVEIAQRGPDGKPIETSKRKYLEVTIEPEVVADNQKRPVAMEDGSPIKLGPQRFNTFISNKARVQRHRLGTLLIGCGVRLEGSILDQIDNVMTQLNGNAIIEAEIIWRTFFKSTDTTISTHPRGKRSGELLWPRAADGSWELMATDPKTGEKQYGYAEIANIKAPSAPSGDQNLATTAS